MLLSLPFLHARVTKSKTCPLPALPLAEPGEMARQGWQRNLAGWRTPVASFSQQEGEEGPPAIPEKGSLPARPARPLAFPRHPEILPRPP